MIALFEFGVGLWIENSSIVEQSVGEGAAHGIL